MNDKGSSCTIQSRRECWVTAPQCILIWLTCCAYVHVSTHMHAAVCIYVHIQVLRSTCVCLEVCISTKNTCTDVCVIGVLVLYTHMYIYISVLTPISSYPTPFVRLPSPLVRICYIKMWVPQKTVGHGMYVKKIYVYIYIHIYIYMYACIYGSRCFSVFHAMTRNARHVNYKCG